MSGTPQQHQDERPPVPMPVTPSQRRDDFHDRASISEYVSSVESPRHGNMVFRKRRSGGNYVVYACLECGAECRWSKRPHTAEFRLNQVPGTPGRTCTAQDESHPSPAQDPSVLRAENEQAKREVQQLKTKVQRLEAEVAELQRQKDKIARDYAELRRTSHNTIQELRGNVRVLVRAKPIADDEVSMLSSGSDRQHLTVTSEQATQTFVFDKVLPMSTTQEEVYAEVSGLVQSAVDGNKVSLFAYGQTSSGKTHTMLGDYHGSLRGIVPRAVQQVLDQVAQLRNDGWNYVVEVSALQVYNEQVHDLLCPGELKKLAVRKLGGQVTVPGLARFRVNSSGDVEKLLQQAVRGRSTAGTAMNPSSSRSHFVFTLHLVGNNVQVPGKLHGELHFVDLAGSERMSSSASRSSETKAINKSLSALKDVFEAIRNGRDYIPFRNSKLTFLLQSSFQSGGIVRLIANVSSAADAAAETLHTLRFAAMASACSLGRPKHPTKPR